VKTKINKKVNIIILFNLICKSGNRFEIDGKQEASKSPVAFGEGEKRNQKLVSEVVTLRWRGHMGLERLLDSHHFRYLAIDFDN
jgi:hypothetical protein